MHRREFTAALGATAALAVLTPGAARAQAVEGQTYTRLASPQPVAVPGKIEVLEFFGYWCPHCNALEPALEAWVKRQPADVAFRRLPVAWQAFQEPYQRLYFALEALGLPADIHARVFAAVHVQRLRLDTDAGLAAFASANGLDTARIADAMKSFSVAAKVNQARKTWSAYGLDSVPSLIVDGRYLAKAQGDGNADATLRIVDALVGKVRAKA